MEERVKNSPPPQFLLKLLGWLSGFVWWLADIVANLPGERLSKIRERRDIVNSHPPPQRKGHKPLALYFCSSAGEFEQVLPLIERLEEWQSVICFFSPSGISYAQKRANIPYFLFPGDKKSTVRKVFKTLSPDLVVVNRWEFWPNFLLKASKQSYLCLVNFALTKPTEKGSYIERCYKRALLSSFDQIHCVGPLNALYVEHLLGRSVKIGTDTKFDRVLDRSENLWSELTTFGVTPLGKALRRQLKSTQVLVIGSSWKEDHALLFPIVAKKNDWSVIVCPHDISKPNIALCCQQLREAGLTYSLYSDLTNEKKHQLDAIVIDNIGMLAEVYSAGDAAWVGGACHYRIHNTLEPASYDLPLAFGPMYQTSIEAGLMVKAGIGLSTNDPDAIHHWLEAPGPRTRKFVEERAGGANILVASLRKEINPCK